jgi:hypothetical protein
VLHEVTVGGGGPRDSLKADGSGRFRFGVSRPDTAALYMVSTTFRGLTYFSAVVPGRDTSAALGPLVVFDTSSTGPAIIVAQRHIVVRSATAGGSRAVLELVALANDGARTRIAGTPPRPTWVGRLPAGATNFQVGQGDVSAEAVQAVGDSVVVTAPVPPGVKQLVFTYDVPGGKALRLPIDQPAERLLVLLEDTAAVLTEGPLQRQGVQVFNDTQFALFSGAAPSGGGAMAFAFGRSPRLATKTLTLVVVGITALLLIIAVPMLWRRAPAPVVAMAPETPEALARRIAVLDAEHARAGSLGPDAEHDYQSRRAALKAELNAALARRQHGS